jgi:hypothetical protein
MLKGWCACHRIFAVLPPGPEAQNAGGAQAQEDWRRPRRKVGVQTGLAPEGGAGAERCYGLRKRRNPAPQAWPGAAGTEAERCEVFRPGDDGETGGGAILDG